ncbi:hypothetical protein PoB_003920400 [Plakobranchus ocellatus]|uniref:Uncharacterized protein n=1 Tax=Plakobranchus ocellatus TaxID=259542 RepID=A0AAV4B1Z3_9GAST|nr:hypothetical protein PoB_003920400 [Plakobranchus ocellatus]
MDPSATFSVGDRADSNVVKGNRWRSDVPKAQAQDDTPLLSFSFMLPLEHWDRRCHVEGGQTVVSHLEPNTLLLYLIMLVPVLNATRCVPFKSLT